MKRREWLAIVGGAVLAACEPVVAAAQPASKLPRVCFMEFSESSTTARYAAFFQTLEALGYRQGLTVVIDRKSAENRTERFPDLARDCVKLQPDVIVVHTTPAAQAAKETTSTIPIVMMGLGDPVGTGLVESLARPGGNATGTSAMTPVLAAKRVELLKEAVPTLARLMLLSYPPDSVNAGQVMEVARAARSLGITVNKREIRTAADIPAAFEAGATAGDEALLTTSVSLFFVQRSEILKQAARLRWPGAFPWREYAEEGGLLYYGQRPDELSRRAALMVDKILKGAKPADMPVEQPTQFDLVINLKSARALGIAIPQSLLARASEVIE